MNSKLAAAAIVAMAAFLIPSAAVAGPACTGLNPGDAPTGCIFDLDTTTETGGGDANVLSQYTFFTTSFTATATAEDVSFAFRESPAYFSFDDACVVAGSTAVTSANCVSNAGNLLVNTAFQGSNPGDNCGNGGSGTPCPLGWGAWIQAIDTSAIGQIVNPNSTGGCGAPGAPPTGSATSTWWCDGSVEGYDAIYQPLTGLTVGQTYQVGWWLDDNSQEGITETPGSGQIDMLVYAGTQLPVGSIPIGNPPVPPNAGTVPEPTTYALVGLGLVAMGTIRARKSRKA
jgi:hypothetical protein